MLIIVDSYKSISLITNSMNLYQRSVLFAASALFLLGNLSSCSKYSPDDPLPDVYNPTIYTGNNNEMVYAIDPETGNTQWKYKVAGAVHATPVVFKDKLWVGTIKGNLYRFDYKKGTLIDSLIMNDAIEGTPLIYNDFLVVPTGNQLKAIDDNLETVWSYNVGGAILASPTTRKVVEHDDPLIFISGTNNKVIALDKDGNEVWSFAPAAQGSFVSSPCAVNDSFVYVGNNNGFIYAIFAHNGTEKWKFKTDGQVKSSPVHINGNVLVGSLDRNFYSVDSATGQLRWKITTEDAIVSSPAVYNQNVYFGGYDGNVYCIDIIDGTLKWKQLTFGLIKSSPVIYKGSVFIGGFDKNFLRLDAANGGQYWNKNIYGQMEASAIIDSLTGVALPSISGNYGY